MENEDNLRICTVKDPHHCLTKSAQKIETHEEGVQIVRQLKQALLPRMPAAGLAASQIGISKQVFIFSWNRDPQQLVGAINPSFEPIGYEKEFGWEGCFSVPLVLANVPRFVRIKATYTNEEGKRATYQLEGFAARVFQHECDHLQGKHIDTIHAQVKDFESEEEFLEFIKEVKQGDAANYIEPALVCMQLSS